MNVRKTIAAAFCLIVAGSHADAAVMHVHDSSGNLGTVNTATGAVTIIGGMGQVMTDIAFDPSGNLFGITFTQLFSINATTGQTSLIGSHGVSNGNGLVFGSDGTLYASGNTTSNLFTLNLATGAGTSLGSTGFTSGGDLAFVGDDLYLASASGHLVKIDLNNPSASSSVGPFGVSNVFGIATSSDGTLFGVAGTSIYTIDFLTGAATNPVSFASQGLGQAFGQAFFTEAGAEPPVIPLPAPVFLLVGALGLLGVAGRRRRA